MIERLKLLNENLILLNKDNFKEKEKYLVIRKILNKKDFLLNTNIKYVYAILRDLKIKEEDIFIIANSIGGVILSAYVHDFAPNIAGIALLAPAFEIKLYIPFAKQLITLLTKINKNAKVMSYVKAKVLTHDVEEQNKYNSDKLINKEINARLLIDLANMGKRLVEDFGYPR